MSKRGCIAAAMQGTIRQQVLVNSMPSINHTTLPWKPPFAPPVVELFRAIAKAVKNNMATCILMCQKERTRKMPIE